MVYYVVRIILNLVNQKRNIYHKKYVEHERTHQELPERAYEQEDEDIGARLLKEIREEKLIGQIGKLDDHFQTFFYRHLLVALQKNGSMRETSRKTGIPVSTISESVKRIRKYLESC